ncbi:SAM-dependent methyltransferase [Hamadaea flava]|uniref:Class I SAM-dependent methyltransferase n=1 Tax=Hamadaea flava TaxID=1742688 RepID=A0ABV8M3B3_9ACTN|nr:class I SAM-dependent methyltransferase [Hamadaea flava]MCP2328560.1 SAM-dependent methyltransferase [Hamadaea flava]
MPDAVSVTRSTYDVIAAQFAEAQAEGYPELTADLTWLASRISAGSRVADVGCGPGRDLALLRGIGFRAIGLDLSAEMLRAGGHTGVAQADMRTLPLRDGCLDGLWCQAALLHIPHDHVPEVLAEFARVVRPGGAVHLVVAEGDGEGWERHGYGGDGLRWFAYHRLDSLTDLLAAVGLTVLEATHRSHYRAWLGVRAAKLV